MDMQTGNVHAIYVGMGWLGKHMHQMLSQRSWYKPVAVVDVRDDALSAAGEILGLPKTALFKDLDAALAQSDANVVLVNTPSELHFEQTCTAINAGRHVLVAKPITNNFEQARTLVALAQQQGVTLSVGQQIRYNRHYQAVQRFMAEDHLGQVQVVNLLNTKPRPNPANLAKMTQPALYEWACHHFDSLLSLFPTHAPEWISIDGFRPSWSSYAGPCMINGLIRLSGNVHVLYHAGFSSHADCYELRLEGDKGDLRCRGIHMSNDYMVYEFAARGQKWAITEVDQGIPTQEPFLPFADVWHAYLNGGAEPPFSGRNNLKVFAMLSAGIDAAESGQPQWIASNPRYAPAFTA